MKNNQWKPVNIAVIAGILFCGIIIGLFVEHQLTLGSMFKANSSVVSLTPSPMRLNDDITADKIISLVNTEREKQGISDVSQNDQLQSAAKAKADDLLAQNYWAETGPDGKSPWLFIKNAGFYYEYAAMDLARGFSTSSQVVDSWINNQTDKTNILNQKFTDIGVAVEKEQQNGLSTTVVVQFLASKQSVSGTSTIQQQTYTSPAVQSPTDAPVPTIVQKILVNIDDSGGITHGSFYCYADKVNELANLQNQIRIDDIAATSCTSIAQSNSSICSSQCSNNPDFNSCDQQCINSYFSTCSGVNNKVGDERKQLYTMVHNDCP